MTTDLDRPGSLHLMALRDMTPSRMGARMTALLPDIESALAHGFTRHAIHEALVVSGLQVGFLGFVKSLYRARKKVRSRPAAGAPTAPLAATPPEVRATAPHQVAPVPPPKAPIPSAPVAPPAAASTWKPGSIAEIARSQPDMAGLAKKGREYAAKRAAEKKLKAEQEKMHGNSK